MLSAIAFTVIGFAFGFPAAFLWFRDRRQDTLSARRVAKITGMGRGEVARLRKAGVL